MIFSKNIYLFAIMVVLTVLGFCAGASAQTVEDKPYDLMYLMIGNSVEGFWNLNIDESDDIRQKIQTLMQKSFVTPDKSLSADQSETQGISISISPPQRLVLVGSENEITINEIYPEVISTRSLITDGRIHFYHNNNAEVAVNAVAEKNKVSIKTLSPRGNQMIETFELSADSSKLKVTIRISDSNFQELLTLQRIYDRAKLDEFSE